MVNGYFENCAHSFRYSSFVIRLSLPLTFSLHPHPHLATQRQLNGGFAAVLEVR